MTRRRHSLESENELHKKKLEYEYDDRKRHSDRDKSKNDRRHNSKGRHSNSLKNDKVEDSGEDTVKDKVEEGLEVNVGNNVEESIEDRLENKVEENAEENMEDNIEDKYYNIDEEEKNSKELYEIDVDKDVKKDCEVTVISETIPICENSQHTSEVTTGTVIVKLPVQLAEFSVTITVKSSLKFEENVMEIKRIRKNVYLNQCKLIPNSEDDITNTGVLFIEGFIRKDVEYTAKDHNAEEMLCGKLRHAAAKVPFKCVTRVKFSTPPKFTVNESQNEVELLDSEMKVSDLCEEHVIGQSTCERIFKFTEFFDEKVFCELVSAEIAESDILENSMHEECESSIEQPFPQITEKVVLVLTIKLLQKQHVRITSS